LNSDAVVDVAVARLYGSQHTKHTHVVDLIHLAFLYESILLFRAFLFVWLVWMILDKKKADVRIIEFLFQCLEFFRKRNISYESSSKSSCDEG